MHSWHMQHDLELYQEDSMVPLLGWVYSQIPVHTRNQYSFATNPLPLQVWEGTIVSALLVPCPGLDLQGQFLVLLDSDSKGNLPLPVRSNFRNQSSKCIQVPTKMYYGDTDNRQRQLPLAVESLCCRRESYLAGRDQNFFRK